MRYMTFRWRQLDPKWKIPSIISYCECSCLEIYFSKEQAFHYTILHYTILHYVILQELPAGQFAPCKLGFCHLSFRLQREALPWQNIASDNTLLSCVFSTSTTQGWSNSAKPCLGSHISVSSRFGRAPVKQISHFAALAAPQLSSGHGFTVRVHSESKLKNELLYSVKCTPSYLRWTFRPWDQTRGYSTPNQHMKYA